MDRSGTHNLYGRYKRQRQTKREKNSNLESHLHPDLVNHSRVSIQKYDKRTLVRGLPEDETPFPVSPRIGPYIVSI